LARFPAALAPRTGSSLVALAALHRRRLDVVDFFVQRQVQITIDIVVKDRTFLVLLVVQHWELGRLGRGRRRMRRSALATRL
jgi:hypothetical protein